MMWRFASFGSSGNTTASPEDFEPTARHRSTSFERVFHFGEFDVLHVTASLTKKLHISIASINLQFDHDRSTHSTAVSSGQVGPDFLSDDGRGFLPDDKGSRISILA